MNNIFYNVVSIVIGVILISFGIVQIVKHIISVGVISLIHGVLFLGLGISCFFLPEKYQVITILGMLALTITMILTLLLTKKNKS